MFRAHVLIIRRSKLHYTTSGIITNLLWNKFCASSWLNTEINIPRCTVSKTSKNEAKVLFVQYLFITMILVLLISKIIFRANFFKQWQFCPHEDWFWPSLGEYKHRRLARSGLRVGRSSGAVSCQPLGKHFINNFLLGSHIPAVVPSGNHQRCWWDKQKQVM